MKANRWFCLILAICLVFTLTACGGGGGSSSDDPSGSGGGNNGGGGQSVLSGPWLCFTAIKAGSTVSTTNNWGPVTHTPSLEYSTDGKSWKPFILNTGNDAANTKITLAKAGDKVYIRATGTNDSFSENTHQIEFKMEGSIAASGNIMSLLDKTCTSTVIPCNSCFRCLFADCSSLVTAPELPAETLTAYCYNNMFYGCTNLTTVPALPAATLAVACYEYMFSKCTNLKTAPALPATILAQSCYGYMFKDCSSLTEAPTLPAATLAVACYEYMFYGCTNLTTAPTLPVTTLALGCYGGMFNGCSSLTTAPALPATTLAVACYKDMFYGCTNLTTAPTLPATILAQSCYAGMFEGCMQLNYIKVHFTDWNEGEFSTASWVNGVADSGEFHCRTGLVGDFEGSEIPKDYSHNWTVIKDVPEPAP